MQIVKYISAPKDSECCYNNNQAIGTVRSNGSLITNFDWAESGISWATPILRISNVWEPQRVSDKKFNFSVCVFNYKNKIWTDLNSLKCGV